MDLNDPIAVLLAAADALGHAGVRHAAYGGLALAVYGQPRETRDADLAVTGVGAVEAHAAIQSIGVASAPSFQGVRFGGLIVTRFALMGGGQLNTVDLVEPASPRFAREALDRALSGTLRGQRLSVLSPEDFVLFKVLSTRARDLEDARSVLAGLGSDVDVSFVASEATRLAAELPEHDTADRLRQVLA